LYNKKIATPAAATAAATIAENDMAVETER
jgi:hypothetical protein